tara:strand:- start:488 stop:826 length:339 start_codon:yes stop_codon:yes gene_type:complete
MEIAEDDNEKRMIDATLGNIEKILRKNYNDIKCASGKNEHLLDVLQEYTVHHDALRKQKEEECEALWTLTNYIQDTANEQTNSKELLRELKKDQSIIIKEIKKVEKEMSKMK